MNTVRKFLEYMKAYGEKKAVKATDVAKALDVTSRHVKAMVYEERAAGSLICNNTTPGGYFLPASPEDVFKQRERLEQGIKKGALALPGILQEVEGQGRTEENGAGRFISAP